ncbi:MAG: penicillin-binding protein activator [Deltaproteobacteria bacterium]|nr:MAG: penicillin-binding protein activator [Deltaproteobacteria bacterium]
MRLRRQIIRGFALWLVLFLLAGCALLPAKKEIAAEPPSTVDGKAAPQQLARAEAAFQQGNMEEASQQYRELAMAFPRSPEAAKALLRQGEIAFRLERYGEAVSWFEEVMNRFPIRPEGDEARLWLLRCYVKLERFNDAVETGRSLMAYLPKKSQRAEAAEVVGDAQGAQEKYVEAVKWYVKAYSLAGEDKHSALTEKVDGALDQVDRDQVLALLAHFPVGFPSLQLQTRMVEIDMESGQLVMAQQQLQALIEKQPEHPLAETWRTMAERIEEWLKVDMTTVGCVLPLSGRYQAYGDKVLRGLVMAAQDLKVQITGSPDIKLVIKDSGGDADLAVAAVRDLVLNHRVAAIIGPLSRVAAEAVAEEAQKLWVPIITLTQKEGVSELGNFVFRNFLSNEQQTKALVEYAVLGLGYRRFAILYPNDGYGSRLMNLFWDELDRLGGEVRGVEAYEPSQTDFADQIKKIVGLYYPRLESELMDETGQIADAERLAEKPAEEGTELPEEDPLPILDFEAIFIPDGYGKVGLIAPQLAYHDVTGIKLMGTNLWNSPKLIEMAAPYLQGAVFVDGFFPESSLPLTRQFVRRYEDTFGEKPGYPEAQAYDTMRLLVKALQHPGVTSRPMLRDAILAIQDLPGVAGIASVDPEGDVSKPPFLIAIERRRMAEIQVDFEYLRQQQSTLDIITEHQISPREHPVAPDSTSSKTGW